jgi:hypothetical protein
MGNLFTLRLLGKVQDVIAPVVHFIAGAPHGADGGVFSDRA